MPLARRISSEYPGCCCCCCTPGVIHSSSTVCTDDLAFWVPTWCKAGDRPYWVDSRVRQFDHTCESGYGMPRCAALFGDTS